LAKVLYGVSPIGLGHASRAAAVGGELMARGADVTFATGGPAVPFLRSYGFEVKDVVREPNPMIWKGRNIFSSLWYLRYWRGYQGSKTRMSGILSETHPDLIVGDEEFSVLSLALDRGMKGIMISDELELGFARTFVSRGIEQRVALWYKELQESVSLLIVPDYGTDERNIWHCGPIVRRVTMGRDETLGSLGLLVERRLVLVSLSGSGSGAYLVSAVEKAVEGLGFDVTLAVAGGREARSGDRLRHLGFVREAQNLVAAADIVISQAGKSTIDEAFSSGTPIVAIPLKDHFEQEANARALGFSHDDIGRLGYIISNRIGKRGDQRNYDGARKAAERILDFA
jgi:UDP-N-acetylglucosamine--N-acetylmuramyl-(pentapeptide) pyrophosphoryl-undecaprenol N-acetylglucosamine transferase